jgi:hypothetical protein
MILAWMPETNTMPLGRAFAAIASTASTAPSLMPTITTLRPCAASPATRAAAFAADVVMMVRIPAYLEPSRISRQEVARDNAAGARHQDRNIGSGRKADISQPDQQQQAQERQTRLLVIFCRSPESTSYLPRNDQGKTNLAKICRPCSRYDGWPLRVNCYHRTGPCHRLVSAPRVRELIWCAFSTAQGIAVSSLAREAQARGGLRTDRLTVPRT